MDNTQLFMAAAPLVQEIVLREPHETKAQDAGRAVRNVVVTGAKHTARSAVVTGHVVRGFLSGLFRG